MSTPPAHLIELGEDWSVPAEQPVPRRRARRMWWLAAVLVACVPLSGAAAPRPGLVPLLRLPYAASGSFTIAAGTLVILGDGVLTAFALPDGARRWRTRVSPAIDSVTYLDDAGVVVASGEQQFATTGLDYRTGRVLWQRDGAYLASVLVSQHLAVIVTPPATTAGALTGIDLRSGRTVWTRSLPPGAAQLPSVPDATSVWYAIQEPDGGVDVLDATTGAPVARAPITVPVHYPGISDLQSSVSLIGHELITLVPDGAGWTLASFDVPTMAPRWRTTLAFHPQYSAPCGRLLCLFSPGILAVDPDSGGVAWRTSTWQIVNELPDGLLLLSRFEQGQASAVRLARPDTLRPVMDLTGWAAVTDPTTLPLVLTRDSDARHTWFATVDIANHVVHVLDGAAGVVSTACWATGGYLACPVSHAHLQVWRYPTGGARG